MRNLFYISLAFSLFIQTPEMETLLTPTNALAMSKGHGAVDVVQRHAHVDVHVSGEGEFTFWLIRLADGKLVDSDKGESSDVFRYSKSELGNGEYLVRVIFDGKPIKAYFLVEA